MEIKSAHLNQNQVILNKPRKHLPSTI